MDLKLPKLEVHLPKCLKLPKIDQKKPYFTKNVENIALIHRILKIFGNCLDTVFDGVAGATTGLSQLSCKSQEVPAIPPWPRKCAAVVAVVTQVDCNCDC
jgi:hypothetical protein